MAGTGIIAAGRSLSQPVARWRESGPAGAWGRAGSCRRPARAPRVGIPAPDTVCGHGRADGAHGPSAWSTRGRWGCSGSRGIHHSQTFWRIKGLGRKSRRREGAQRQRSAAPPYGADAEVRPITGQPLFDPALTQTPVGRSPRSTGSTILGLVGHLFSEQAGQGSRRPASVALQLGYSGNRGRAGERCCLWASPEALLDKISQHVLWVP